jgi:transposase
MKEYMPLTDQDWEKLFELFPRSSRKTVGKPHTPWRSVLNSILCVLVTGCKWSALPQDPAFASKSAANRWFIAWEKNGFLGRILQALNMSIQGPQRLRAIEKVFGT